MPHLGKGLSSRIATTFGWIFGQILAPSPIVARGLKFGVDARDVTDQRCSGRARVSKSWYDSSRVNSKSSDTANHGSGQAIKQQFHQVIVITTKNY